MNDLSQYFLLGWAVTMTILAGWYQHRYYKVNHEKGMIVDLLGEICIGEVKPTITHGGNGFMVENDSVKLGGVRRSAVKSENNS